MLCINISGIAIIAVKGLNYCRIIHGISKSEAIHSLENSVLSTKAILKIRSANTILTIQSR